MALIRGICILNKFNEIKSLNTFSSAIFKRNLRTILFYKNSYCNNYLNLRNSVVTPYLSVIHSHHRHLSCSHTVSLSDKLEGHKSGLAEELLVAKVSSNDPKAKEDHEKSSKSDEDKDKTIRTIKFTFYAFGIIITTIGGTLIYSWGAPQCDSSGKIIADEFSDLPLFKQYVYRTIHEAKNMNKMIQEPSRDKLLPDPLKEPYIQPPYTLVLELKDILVHPEWTYETGWRFKKRPGVEFLLQHCSPPLFEIVIYTNEQAFTAYPVIEQLDQNNFIWYKLFKDSTRYTEGKHLKDLNCLNRDLSKVIVVDWDREAITSSRNQLTLPRWKGNMNDQTLVELAMMLRTIAESQVSDVREVLDYYRSFSDPIEAFKENQRVAQVHEEEIQKAVKEQNFQKGLMSSWTGSFLKRK